MRFRYVIYGDIFTEEREDKTIAREEAQKKLEEKAMTIGGNIDSLDLLEDLLKPEAKDENFKTTH
jgi:hypothetical protein